MKYQTRHFIIAMFIVLTSPSLVFAQSPNLRSSINFAIFTKTGAVSNAGTSNITGDVGTNTGAIAGFGAPTILIGNIHQANSVTAQCAIDLKTVYDEISGTTTTIVRTSPVFGNGETLIPGVYYVASAGSTSGGANEVDGSLYLDAQGNPDALFIFKFGGAFSTGANSTINLINGASACNIFWVVEGAISMAANTNMKGTLISNNGAVSMAADGTLVGRLFSTTGAMSVTNTVIIAPTTTCEVLLSIGLLSFKGHCDNQNIVLQWSSATEVNNDYFTIERSLNGIKWDIVGKVNGVGNSSVQNSYSLIDRNENKVKTYYRLKQTDFDGTYKYANVIAMNKCKYNVAKHFTIYPNPSTGKVNLSFEGNTSEIKSIDVFNSQGQNVHSIIGFQSVLDLSDNIPGYYLIRIQHNSETISLKFILK